MVEDPSNSEVMWSESGLTFIVTSPIEFSKRLHNYFKHNNWQSFVRQLNMYQFHKVNDVFHANPAAVSASSETAAWEFKHPYFQRDRVDLLANIKRKASRPLPLNRESFQDREQYGYHHSSAPQPHPYEQANMHSHHQQQQQQQNHLQQHQQPFPDRQRLEHVIDTLEQRIHGMEESQRLLMDQTANVFGTLRAYHGILSGVSNILAAVQPDENTAALQADLAALHQQMTTSQFAPRRMAASGMHIAMPARPMTFATQQAVYTPGSTSTGWSHPGTPIGIMQTPIFSPTMRPSPELASDSYFRQARPLPPQQQQQQQQAQHQMHHHHFQQGAAQGMYASHPLKSPTWGTAILSPPLSDTSRGTLSPFPDGGNKYTSQARHDHRSIATGPSLAAVPGTTSSTSGGNGSSLQSLLNKNEEQEDSRKRRKAE